MKKTINYIFVLALAILACSCGEKEPVGGLLRGVFYADVPGDKAVVTLPPGSSKSYSVKVCAQGDKVSDVVMNFALAADPDRVAAISQKEGASFEMCPGSAYEFATNEVMMPRYGKASTTARVKITTSGLEANKTYALPITIEKATGSDNWEIADTLAGYVLFKLSDFDPNGPGTEGNPYPISSVDDLKAMKDKLVEGSKVYFRMDADIDMAAVTDWTPVCEVSPYKPFIFDGDGHTISNFTGTTSLFGCVSGKVCNLTMTGVKIENAAGPAGIIGDYGGEAGNPVEVEHVYVQGKITNTAGHGTGGIFGIITEATINACSADVTLVATGKYDVGGIYGYDNTDTDKKSVISNCWTAGDISGNRMVGGIAGMMSTKESEATIKNCYSTARVHAQFKYAGIAGDAIMGLKGDNATKTAKNHVEKCIAWNEALYSDVADEAVHYSAGAIVGFTSLKNYHVDCYRKADLSFSDCPGNGSNVLVDQANSSPESPLVEVAVSAGSTNYNFPYHGKAAAKDATASQVAKALGWDETIWDLSGTLPFFKGASAPVENPDINAGGQLPDFPENEFYN